MKSTESDYKTTPLAGRVTFIFTIACLCFPGGLMGQIIYPDQISYGAYLQYGYGKGWGRKGLTRVREAFYPSYGEWDHIPVQWEDGSGYAFGLSATQLYDNNLHVGLETGVHYYQVGMSKSKQMADHRATVLMTLHDWRNVTTCRIAYGTTLVPFIGWGFSAALFRNYQAEMHIAHPSGNDVIVSDYDGWRKGDFTFVFNAGVSLNIEKFSLDLRYDLTRIATDTFEGSNIFGIPEFYGTWNHTFSLRLNYFFLTHSYGN